MVSSFEKWILSRKTGVRGILRLYNRVPTTAEMTALFSEH